MTIDAARSPPPVVEATCLRLDAKAADAWSMTPRLAKLPLRRTHPDEALVKINAAAVNPSDVKAAIGMMPYAAFPRTPGRDFAGVVIDGPSQLLGKEVFGSTGARG